MLGILPMNWESDRYRPRDSLVAGNVDRRGNLDSAQTLEEGLEVVEERQEATARNYSEIAGIQTRSETWSSFTIHRYQIRYRPIISKQIHPHDADPRNLARKTSVN